MERILLDLLKFNNVKHIAKNSFGKILNYRRSIKIYAMISNKLALKMQYKEETMKTSAFNSFEKEIIYRVFHKEMGRILG